MPEIVREAPTRKEFDKINQRVSALERCRGVAPAPAKPEVEAETEVLCDVFTHVYEGAWNPPSCYVDVPQRFKGQRIHIQIVGPKGGDHAGTA